MKRFVTNLVFGALSWCLVAGSPASAAVVDDLTTALKSGKADVGLLASFEYKNRDDATSPAKQFSLRTRIGYRTGNFHQFSLYAQFHNLTNAWEEFRHADGGEADRDLIADPDGNRLYKAYLDYSGLPQTTVRLGRQEIILDDARLLGNIGWRLNGQSFDAVTVTNKSIADLTLFAGYVNQVNTIALTHVDLDHFYLINAQYAGVKNHKLSVYGYLLDTESTADSARDCATYGVRVVGKPGMFNYALDYTLQTDFADGEDHDADMLNLYAGATVAPIDFGVGYSYISGQDGDDRPFDTLYSTAHKFNGFADLFLSTNGGSLTPGLQDYYAKVATTFLGVKLSVIYHYFDSYEDDQFDGTYGDEVDVVVVKPISDNLKLLVKYANFMQDDDESNGFANPTVDTEILTARLEYKF
jgi:hypothetical protein